MARNSRELDNIFNECLERLLQGESVDLCLSRYPEQANELRPLLHAAVQIKKATAVQPRPEFKAKARYQFLSAHQPEEARPRPAFSWWPRWATVIAAFLIIMLAGGGTVVGASNSMPDQPLYPVKLATEQVRITLTPSKIGKAELYAQLADKRVSEIIYLASKGNSEELEKNTERIDQYLSQIETLAAAREQGDQEKAALAPTPEPAPRLASVPAPSTETPPMFSATAEEGANDSSSAAETQPQPNDKTAKLKKELRDNAANNRKALQEILKTAPASVKKALEHAISVSDERYEKLLKALG